VRLEPRDGERIDRSKPVTFSFDGWSVTGFEGDTLASAAFAAGKRVFSRSFKYHRPRGLVCCSGHCPNCMMTVDGVPNVRTCVEPIREGAVAKAQNVLGASFASLGQRDRARAAFSASLQSDPHDPAAYSNLATLEMEAGDLPRARRYFAEALTLDPTNEIARQGLATVLAQR